MKIIKEYKEETHAKVFTFYEQYAGGTRFQAFTRVLNKVFEMEATLNVTSLMLLLRPTNRTVIAQV